MLATAFYLADYNAKLAQNMDYHLIPISLALIPSAIRAAVSMVMSGVCASLRQIIMDVLLSNLY